MSAIQGAGWGFDHEWRNLGTWYRATRWVCEACGCTFQHDYPRVPEIGKAMFEEGVPEHCPARSRPDNRPLEGV